MENSVEVRLMEEKNAYQTPTVSNISAEPFVIPAVAGAVALAAISGAVSGAVSSVVSKAIG